MIKVPGSQSYFDNSIPCTLFLKNTMRGIKNHVTIQFFGKSMNGNNIGGKLRYMYLFK